MGGHVADEVGEAGRGERLAKALHDRRREDDVADQAKADEQDVQGSIVASSMSMTGMSSLMG